MSSPLTTVSDTDLLRYATQEEIDEAKTAGFFDKEWPVVDLDKPGELATTAGGSSVVESARRGVWLPYHDEHLHRTYYGILDHGPRVNTEYLVLHVNAGTYPGTLSWFKGGSRGVGAHVEIGPGYMTQMVPLQNKCWHAVEANSHSVGIEHAGFGRTVTEWEAHGQSELRVSAQVTSWMLHEFNLGRPERHKNIMYHSDGGAAWGGHACPGAHFPWILWERMCRYYYLAHWGR